MTQTPPSKRTTVIRRPQRADYDRAAVHAVLDAAHLCHVAFVAEDGSPAVIPINHWRIGDQLYIHGSPKGRLRQATDAGREVCVAVSILDGLVLARSAFAHSANYRSAIVYGRFRPLTDDGEKTQALYALIEKLVPGRTAEVRPINAKELAVTSVMALSLAEASVKMRDAPPGDPDEDCALPVWAGVIPVRQTLGAPVADPRLDPTLPLPDYVRQLLG